MAIFKITVAMDSKNIKDYLHLYLGCRLKIGEGSWADNAPHTFDAHLRSIESGTGLPIKLILRPLSDITEEEIKELFKYEDIKHSYSNISFERHVVLNNILRGITVNYDTVTPEGTFSSSWTLNFSGTNAHDFKWLLSKGFDLFGLIDAGLAIKKSD